jgi:hypothetical protein
MPTTKFSALMNLMDRNMEEEVDEAWLTAIKRRHHFLGKTMVGTWTPEEEKLYAELSPEEQMKVHDEISARADGYESWDTAMREEHKRRQLAAEMAAQSGKSVQCH